MRALTEQEDLPTVACLQTFSPKTSYFPVWCEKVMKWLAVVVNRPFLIAWLL